MAEPVSTLQIETSVVFLQEKVEKLRKWQACPHPTIPQLRLRPTLRQRKRLPLRKLLEGEQELVEPPLRALFHLHLRPCGSRCQVLFPRDLG